MKREDLEKYIELAIDDALEGCKSDNPIEAWTRFTDRLDVIGRRHIRKEVKDKSCTWDMETAGTATGKSCGSG